MQKLDGRGRALAHELLRRPDVIEGIADDAVDDEVALLELKAAALLLAALAEELEHELATVGPLLAAPVEDDDIVAETRWTTAAAAGSHA